MHLTLAKKLVKFTHLQEDLSFLIFTLSTRKTRSKIQLTSKSLLWLYTTLKPQTSWMTTMLWFTLKMTTISSVTLNCSYMVTTTWVLLSRSQNRRSKTVHSVKAWFLSPELTKSWMNSIHMVTKIKSQVFTITNKTKKWQMIKILMKGKRLWSGIPLSTISITGNKFMLWALRTRRKTCMLRIKDPS